MAKTLSFVGLSEPSLGQAYETLAWWWFAAALIVGGTGAGLGYWLRSLPSKLPPTLKNWLVSGYRIAELYRIALSRPLLTASRFVASEAEARAFRWTLGRVSRLLRSDAGVDDTSGITLDISLLLFLLGIILTLVYLVIS
jgi:hypothetical protein